MEGEDTSGCASSRAAERGPRICGPRLRTAGRGFPDCGLRTADRGFVIVALVADRTLLAQRAWFADPAAVQDQRVGGDGPFGRRHRRAQLLFDDFRIVAARDPDAVGDPEHVAIHRQAGHAERVAEHDVGGLAADAGKLDQGVHRGGNLALMAFHHRGGHAGQ